MQFLCADLIHRCKHIFYRIDRSNTGNRSNELCACGLPGLACSGKNYRTCHMRIYWKELYCQVERDINNLTTLTFPVCVDYAGLREE